MTTIKTFTLLLVASTLTVAASQPVKLKPLLKNARVAIKNSSGQSKAEDNLLAALDTGGLAPEQQALAYYTCMELQRSVNDQENLKLYLGQGCDTATFFSSILAMHRYALLCDSVETAQGGKPKYRAKGRAMATAYRRNLLLGGKRLLRSGQSAEAYDYFDMYLRLPAAPLTEGDPTFAADTLLSKAAYWATVSAYDAGDPERALAHIGQAIDGAADSLRPKLYECKANCHIAVGDSVAWLATLLYGIHHYPRHDYFYYHLLDHYAAQGLYDKGIVASDSLIKVLGSKAVYWLGKSQMYLGKGDYDSCTLTADIAISLDSCLADAHYNKGIACLNKALIFARSMDRDPNSPKGKSDLTRLRGLYRYARQPLEKVRELEPSRPQRWAKPLYAVYLNLNLGQELAEMERIIAAEEQ